MCSERTVRRGREREEEKTAKDRVVPEDRDESKDAVEGPDGAGSSGEEEMFLEGAMEEEKVEVGEKDPSYGGEDVYMRKKVS